jgi:ketosteroid isomerase-like protein
MHQSEEAIRELFGSLERAMRAGDSKSVVGHYATDVVSYTLAPPLVQDPAEVLDPAYVQAWFDSHGGGPMDYAITELQVTAGGDMAFAHGLTRMGAPDGDGFTLWFRATYGLRCIDGAWAIVHEHESTPFYMDGSLRAAVDLTPAVAATS